MGEKPTGRAHAFTSEIERGRGRMMVREKMGGSITHPDRGEGRADGVLVPLTDRGGSKVGMRDRRGAQ